jgi:hypothetical protein
MHVSPLDVGACLIRFIAVQHPTVKIKKGRNCIVPFYLTGKADKSLFKGMIYAFRVDHSAT